jgi:hypothetical protein
MLKKILIITGSVIAAVFLCAASFYGGITYQKNKASQIQNDFFTVRGGQPPTGDFQTNGQFPGGGQFQGTPQPGASFGRGVTGQIQALDGETLMVTTIDNNVVTVHLSDGTKISKTVNATTGDLTSGTTVTIMGQQQSDGSINASRVEIVDPSLMQQFNVQATGTAP